MRIYIVGFMGSGKTHFGKLWASTYNFSFCDIDTMIEKSEGISIAQIFEIKGEDYFRQKETGILKSTASMKNTIISCGGGTPCFNSNMNWMKENGIVVFLNETVEIILKNVEKDKHERPLLQNKTEEEKLVFIKQKLKDRMPIYKQSHVILSTEQLNVEGFKLVFNFKINVKK
jgi:shikimate kinase